MLDRRSDELAARCSSRCRRQRSASSRRCEEVERLLTAGSCASSGRPGRPASPAVPRGLLRRARRPRSTPASIPRLPPGPRRECDRRRGRSRRHPAGRAVGCGALRPRRRAGRDQAHVGRRRARGLGRRPPAARRAGGAAPSRHGAHAVRLDTNRVAREAIAMYRRPATARSRRSTTSPTPTTGSRSRCADRLVSGVFRPAPRPARNTPTGVSRAAQPDPPIGGSIAHPVVTVDIVPKLDAAHSEPGLPRPRLRVRRRGGAAPLPIHDEAHVRNALARFGQVDFEDDAAREGPGALLEAARASASCPSASSPASCVRAGARVGRDVPMPTGS